MARVLVIALAMVVTGAAAAAAGDGYLLYAPQHAESPRIPGNPADGILVKTITIKRGDTLGKISKRYSGKRGYFPQILLFNRIKNPDRIYTGKSLRVPVTRRSALAAQPADKTDARRTLPPAAVPQTVSKPAKAPVSENRDSSGQQLFDSGVSTYKKGNYREALDLFDQFLKTAPGSPLAADAALYRAECYMKLSGAD